MYFGWLQKDNPTGDVTRFPELVNRFETSVPGLYCVGDLTGVPLIKLAADSGEELLDRLAEDSRYRAQRENNHDPDVLDLLIAGAGPAGVSASIRATQLGYRHLVLEAAQAFNTVSNFPAGKPIFVTPEDRPFRSKLVFSEGTKESLIEQLRATAARHELPVVEGVTVERIVREGDVFTVETSAGKHRALRVVLATGTVGNARRLGVAGENLPKVYTRLVDPGAFTGREVLVVGGGDSALEATVALAQAGNRVTLSYRRAAFSRPKPENTRALQSLADQGAVMVRFESVVKQVREHEVLLGTPGGDVVLANDAVFVLIGTEVPVAFLERSGVRVSGRRGLSDWLKLSAALLFAGVLYFGKKAPGTSVNGLGEFFLLPVRLGAMPWPAMVKGLAAWGGLIGLVGLSVALLAHVVAERRRYFSSTWSSFRTLYFAASMGLAAWLYIAYKLAGQRPVFGDMGSWVTLLYSLTVIVFGLRRMYVKPTGYVVRQTVVLTLIQVIPLCILPMFVFPAMGRAGWLDGWVMDTVFPGQSYWRSYGFILAWPLFIHNLATGTPTAFWLVVGLVQTFVIIPWLNYRWGKGAYCGWICSCGALAETLGDEYRSRAPHGLAAKRSDNIGQVVLWCAAAVTVLALVAGRDGSAVSRVARDVYDVVVDIFCSGVLGVGLYFFWSGRVWCRTICPLAALMHVYTRFSRYRIMSNKKRCISCGICTRVCHMGIDVMGYASRGIPMNDVECVRCSACITSCPMQVLTFGDVGGVDLDNAKYRTQKPGLTPGWASGLPRRDIEMLAELERRHGAAG